MQNEAPRRGIGIYFCDQMEEIDAIGPWEGFAWGTTHFPAGRVGRDHLLGDR